LLSVVGIGKEANRLEAVEAGLVHGWDDVQAVDRHPDRRPWRAVVLPVLRLLAAAKIASASGLTTRAVRSARNGHAALHRGHSDALTRAAADLARKSRRRPALPLACDDLGACVSYVHAHASVLAARRMAIGNGKDPSVSKCIDTSVLQMIG